MAVSLVAPARFPRAVHRAGRTSVRGAVAPVRRGPLSSPHPSTGPGTALPSPRPHTGGAGGDLYFDFSRDFVALDLLYTHPTLLQCTTWRDGTA